MHGSSGVVGALAADWPGAVAGDGALALTPVHRWSGVVDGALALTPVHRW